MGPVMVLRVVAIVSVGLLAGIFSGYRASVHYAVPYLYGPSLVQLQQIIHVHSVNFMPSLIVTALLSSLLWLLAIRRQWRTAEFWLVAMSASGLLVSAAVTLAVIVPLENQLMTWNVVSPRQRTIYRCGHPGSVPTRCAVSSRQGAWFWRWSR